MVVTGKVGKPKKGGPEAGATGGEKKVVASNRKARHDYEIEDVYECGIVLLGSEVKSLRDAKVQMTDAFARVDRGQVYLHGIQISSYAFAVGFGAHEPTRTRKLLLNRREIDELARATEKGTSSLVPLSIYFVNGRAKVELAVARGRKRFDKRQALAERDSKLEMSRALAHANRPKPDRRP
jgi:SsrA-binding protein